jgi:hypothetical protein
MHRAVTAGDTPLSSSAYADDPVIATGQSGYWMLCFARSMTGNVRRCFFDANHWRGVDLEKTPRAKRF